MDCSWFFVIAPGFPELCLLTIWCMLLCIYQLFCISVIVVSSYMQDVLRVKAMSFTLYLTSSSPCSNRKDVHHVNVDCSYLIY